METKLILIFSLIALINSACEPASTEELIQLKKLRDYEDCASRTSVEELEEAGAYKCCHIYYEHDSNISLERIILDTLDNTINFPIIKSNYFGHTEKKTIVPIGCMAKIDTNKKRKGDGFGGNRKSFQNRAKTLDKAKRI